MALNYFSFQTLNGLEVLSCEFSRFWSTNMTLEISSGNKNIRLFGNCFRETYKTSLSISLGKFQGKLIGLRIETLNST